MWVSSSVSPDRSLQPGDLPERGAAVSCHGDGWLGEPEVLQLCRFLHMKTGGEMNYGFHLAHHMALGLLFLGGGR